LAGFLSSGLGASIPTLLGLSVEKNVKNSSKADIVRYYTSASVGHCN